LIVISSISRSGGGVAEAARLLTKAVAEPALDVEVMTLADRYYQQDVSNWTPLPVRAFRFFGTHRYGFSPGILFALLRTDADVAHVHGIWTFHCFAVYLWALLKGRPYVVTPHGMLEAWVRKRSPVLKWIVSSLYQNRFLRKAALFHVLTESEGMDVADFASSPRVRIIPNYVEPFEPANGWPRWWRDEFQGRDIYLYFGRIHQRKGCIELCSAWDQLCSSDASFRDRSALVFGGWIDGLKGFEDRVAELHNRHGNVVFTGAQYGEDKRRTFAAATFFVLPSMSEGLPMSVLEAWAAGKPVLMTPECNLPAGFDSGAALEIGFDEESIRRGLASASSMPPQERAEKSDAARALILERYSAQAVASKALALYRDAMAQ